MAKFASLIPDHQCDYVVKLIMSTLTEFKEIRLSECMDCNNLNNLHPKTNALKNKDKSRPLKNKMQKSHDTKITNLEAPIVLYGPAILSS